MIPCLMGQTVDAQVLYIAGSGRSGSTLLDLLLGNHPHITGLGEVHRVCLIPAERNCACGEPINICPFWSGVIKRVVDRLNITSEDWTEEFSTTVLTDRVAAGVCDLRLIDVLLLIGSYRLMRMAANLSSECSRHIRVTENSWLLFDVVAQKNQTPVVVDSTKNAARMKLLYMARPMSVRVIHLIRDGRAVAHSLRRMYGTDIAQAALQWKRANRNVEFVLKTVPASRQLLVHYEKLCRQPQQVLTRIARFAGLNFTDDMTRLRSHGCHQIPGNRLLFQRGELEIREDETWVREFSPKDASRFDAVAGSLNRRYGYTRTE